MTEPRVRAETYLRSNIQNVLNALQGSIDDILDQLPIPEIAIYRDGYSAALRAAARAFDVQIDDSPSPHFLLMPTVPDGRSSPLDDEETPILIGTMQHGRR